MSWLLKKVYGALQGAHTYAVGYYLQNDIEFTIVKEFDDFEDAANFVHYLNGGSLSRANRLSKLDEQHYG
jgi:hypothetical protein